MRLTPRNLVAVAIAAVISVGLVVWLNSTDDETGAHETSVGATNPSQRPVGPGRCSTVATSEDDLSSAASEAEAGAVVCLADGSYGKLSLDTSSEAPGVTVRAEHPGKASIAGAELSGSHLTLARFDVSDEVTVEPGASAVAVEHNRISGGYFGIDAGPTTSTTVDDVTITGNRFVGPFGEDAIRLNRYHDGDGDGIGALIEGNEFTNVRENGRHSDCLQTVWVGDHLVYRKNYLHDNRCQGFFVKDQASAIEGITVDNNLIVRDNKACDPPNSGCGWTSSLQVFGPYRGLRMTRNTIWQGEPVAVFQEGTGPDTLIDSNVVYRFWTSADLSGARFTDNTSCRREAAPPGGAWPRSTPGEVVDCSPTFSDPSSDDFRLLGSGRGVDWAPADQHYGF